MSILVSVVIVNYNGEEYIEECLYSLYNQTYSNIEIIVLDNNSSDNSVAVLKKHEENIKLILCEENVGFAKGNNIAIKESSGEFIALLNNDAIADKEWIEKMVDAMNNNPLIGSCACKIISYYDNKVMDSAGLLISWDGMSRGRGREESIDNFNNKEYTLIPSGCAALYRKSALSEVGLFDESFFCYCEDTDLGIRLQLQGWRCIYVPEAKVFHRYSESAGKYSLFKAYHVERNHYWVVIKNYPLILVILNPFFTIYRYIYQVLDMFLGRGASNEIKASFKLMDLLSVLYRAHRDCIKEFVPMWRKRMVIQKNKKISSMDFLQWFKSYKITYRELFKK